MKKDMELARRIRWEKFQDHRDLMQKTGNEVFYMLPYRTDADAMNNLKKQIVKRDN